MNRSSKCDDYIYELLNHADIEDIEDIEAKDLDDITARRIKSKINKKIKRKKLIPTKFKIAMATVFLATNVILYANAGFEVYANIGKSIMQTFQELKGDYADYKKYSRNVNLSCTDKGIKVVINEVVTDGNNINISYSLISEGKLKDLVKNPNVIMNSCTINGELIGGSGGCGDMVSDNRYDGIFEEHNINGNSMPIGNFYLYINILSIDELEGDWSFKIKVDKTDIEDKVKVHKINKTIDLGDGDKLKIGEIRTTPLSTAIEVSGSMRKYFYFLIDDKGNEILCNGSGSQNNKGVIRFGNLVSSDTKKLDFIPYEVVGRRSEVKSRIYDINSFPMEISQGNIGKLLVNKLEWVTNDSVKVYYKAEGLVPITQSHNLRLFDENNEAITPENKYNTQKNGYDQSNFQMLFKGLDKNKKYKIGTYNIDELYKINEELKFTIELK